jgi:hypothetical protein
MRGLILGSALLACAFGLTSCARSSGAIKEAPEQLLSVFLMSDPVALPQLVHGFWQLEGGSWRWAAKRSRVVLQAPPGASTRGATLELHFSIPKESIDAADQVTLEATVNGMVLPSVAFAETGPTTFWRVVPAEAFQTNPVTVEITADRALNAIPGDDRELAIITTKIGLLPQ